MPMKPLAACSFPGCPGRATHGSRCELHQRPPRTDTRPNASVRGYGTDWRRTRDEHLKLNPYCVQCGKVGSHVDHIVSRAQGGSDNPGNLQTLCPNCHSRKTAQQDGGFGNRRK